MTTKENVLQAVLKLKTLCVGGDFSMSPANDSSTAITATYSFFADHPFTFFSAESFEQALDIIRTDQDIDLVFVDGDIDPLPELIIFITQVREIRAKLPVVLFTSANDDKMRYLMRAGASWHFCKEDACTQDIAAEVQQHVFTAVNWQEMFSQLSNDLVKPRIEPGLSYKDLETLAQNPEERYIIKRLFAGCEEVQIFRMDEGFSGSRVYTVKPSRQLKRILKIDQADRLERVKEKNEFLIQPRLDQQTGQILGNIVRAQHLAGACYTLAGSTQDTITLTQFLQDQNRVRRELIDKMLLQLRRSLDKLYVGSRELELRYWAPLYARLLPTQLVLADATLVSAESPATDYLIDARELTNLSAVPGNRTLNQINEDVHHGQTPELILCNFEVAELNTEEGVLYLHDDLMSRLPISAALKGKEHPLVRFKVKLRAEDKELLTHPVFRRGKRITIRGRVVRTQETILADNISQILAHESAGEAATFCPQDEIIEFGNGRFISPIVNARWLLWEVSREDMIVPVPQLSPVLHGDLNTNNILVEMDDDVHVWLIDFADARPGHIYFDLAKLEVEFRTHVFYRLIKEMVDIGMWDKQTATRFLLLLETVLLENGSDDFDGFTARLRELKPDWYDTLYTQFPLYAENMLYFLHSLRAIAAKYSPERFKYHYPVAIFFHSVATLKYQGMDLWAKRAALCCSLVSGKKAVEELDKPYSLASSSLNLLQQSAFALIAVGHGQDRRYLLQWNANWQLFNLVGGKLDNQKGDRDSFARTIQRELFEEIGLKSPKDFRIVQENKPIKIRQFSGRDFVFKDYEFRVFHIELLPRHPQTPDEYARFATRFSADRENILVTRSEIERLQTQDGRPISDTTRTILHQLGEITAVPDQEHPNSLTFQVADDLLMVGRGRVCLSGQLTNAQFNGLIESVLVELLPSVDYEVELESTRIEIEQLQAGASYPLDIWLHPKANEAVVKLRITYYDVRGQEHQQLLEKQIYFQAQAGSVLHIENPYVVGKPLTAASEALYVGRDDTFAWIEENLLGKTQPNTLILYGQRRMGKTSTLYQLFSGYRGKTIREYPGTPIFPVYVDLQSLAGSDLFQFLQRLAQLIIRTLAKRGLAVDMIPPFANSDALLHAFDLFLDEVEKALPEHGLVVLIMDEFEQLRDSVERDLLTPDIFPYLRSLMQHRRRLTFILAGTNQLMEQYWSIIFHIGISREIGPLSQKETGYLIREPVLPDVLYDDLAVDAIWRATRGHPYFCQLICHRLISETNLNGRRQKRITIQEVRQTIQNIIREDDSHLLHLWSESSQEEQIILSALAGRGHIGAEAVQRSEILSRLRDASFSEEVVKEALKRLEVRRLVQSQPVERQIERRLGKPNGWQPTLISRDYEYLFSFDLMNRWVAHKRPLGTLIY